MRLLSFALAGSLVLGGCSDGAERAEAGGGNNAAEAVVADTADQTTDAAEENAPAAVEEIEAASPTSNAIPASFQGVWDYTKGTCAPESDLRMEISASEIMFYESIGIVTDAETTEDGVIVTLAMEGEGDTWVQKTLLSMNESGELLETPTLDEGIVGNPLPRKRCPQ